jgi:4-amino-4-deoxy-L-arabinose transferase-like glycosyltransferase
MSDHFRQNKALSDAFLIAGVTLLAAVLRFPLLGRLPPGLYRDEAINGLDALGVLEGVWPIFFTANNGREPLFIYLVAASVGLFGRTALAVRLVSAVLGTLTVPATYLLGRALFGRRVNTR